MNNFIMGTAQTSVLYRFASEAVSTSVSFTTAASIQLKLLTDDQRQTPQRVKTVTMRKSDCLSNRLDKYIGC